MKINRIPFREGSNIVKRRSFFPVVLLLGLAVFSVSISTAQTAGDRGVKSRLKLDIAASTLMALDTILQQGAGPYEAYIMLDTSGAVGKALATLPGDGSRPDVIIFFNSARNMNNYCIIDAASKEETDYCVDAKTVAVMWLDDEPKDRYQIAAAIDEKKSSFVRDLTTVGGLVGKIARTETGGFGFAGEDIPASLPDYSLTAELLTIPTPCELTITMKKLSRLVNTDSVFNYGSFDNIVSFSDSVVYFYSKTDVVLNNYDEQYYGISIGLSSVSVNSRSLSTVPGENGLENVIRNSDKSFETSPSLLFYLQEGRVEAWSPSWKFWKNEFYRDFMKRFSIRAGFDLSRNPFDRLYAGLGFSVTKTVDVVGGLVEAKVADETQVVTAHGPVSIDNVNKKYEPQWFIGFAVKPTFFKELVGL